MISGPSNSPGTPHNPTPGAPFDPAAGDYDRLFEENPITKRIRPLVWQSLLNRFRPGTRVLELNCGTGTDAIMLAGQGIRVTAIDASERMIEQAQRKIRQKHLEPSVTLKHMKFEDLDALYGDTFDGAFSNFGGLNCTGELLPTMAKLSTLIRPEGYFIACVMNRVALWEMISFLAKGNWSSTFRRLRRDGAEVFLGGASAPVWYYSPGQFKKLIAPWFLVENTYGLNILSPSPSSRSFALRYPDATGRLLELDGRIRFRFPWYALGDHFVVEARRRPT